MQKIGMYLFLALTTWYTGCTGVADHNGKTPLVGVGQSILYTEDLQEVLPPGLHGADSTRFVRRYVRNWIENELLFQKAEQNIPGNAEIDRMVEAYRRELIVHRYQEELIRQTVDNEVTEDTIVQYYDRYRAGFRAEEPYVQGLFMKVPLNAPNLRQARLWYKQNTADAVDHLEKFCVGNAVSYDYFYDRWIPVSELTLKIPLKSLDTDAGYLDRNRNIEVKDTAFCYFLHVEKFLPQGEQLPLEYAKPRIKELLINLKRVEFINRMKKDLYKEASENKDIIYYNPKNG